MSVSVATWLEIIWENLKFWSDELLTVKWKFSVTLLCRSVALRTCKPFAFVIAYLFYVYYWLQLDVAFFSYSLQSAIGWLAVLCWMIYFSFHVAHVLNEWGCALKLEAYKKDFSWRVRSVFCNVMQLYLYIYLPLHIRQYRMLDSSYNAIRDTSYDL